MTAKRPLLVGTVTLDHLHEGPLGRARPPVTLAWGGVIHNVACAMAARGADPVFVTATYTGDLAPAVAAHLADHRVDWCPLPVDTPLPVFEAELVDGSVADKHFTGQEALDLLAPALLATRPDLLDRASVVVAGTDGHPATLAWLADAAHDRGIPFWLLSADPTEVHKLVPGSRHAGFVSLNARELSNWAGTELADHDAVATAARKLVAPGGHTLVTLGEQGALLVPEDGSTPLHQPAHPVPGRPLTVGAGDILFACLLSARLLRTPWDQALPRATALTAAYLGTPGYAALRTGA
ncbi:PfkB family carbohydrate kinase [Kitasatospora terrestris]|uniref:1-phosphofructokinase n=1 Tax=Kitasatospora terrestris TaxID=258051 RepID=A0ABP9EBA2_9ACTN